MRSPREIENQVGAEPTTTETGFGVKARERIALFNEQRGIKAVSFELGDSVSLVDEAPKKGRGAKKKGKKAAGKIEESFCDEDIAALYIEGCNFLESSEQAVEELNLASRDSVNIEMAPMAVSPPTWRLVGPTKIPNGQTYGSGRADVSGRVSSVAVDPSNANHILCGSAAGGVWETRNGGRSWSPRTDRMPTLTIGAIAFDSSSPNVVYAGTGEGDFYWRLGAGLLRSTNGGRSWSVHATAPFVGTGFQDLIVDPADGDHLLAGTTHGLFESTNGGGDWTRRRTARTWKMSMEPTGGASAEVLAACQNGLFQSTNGGRTWSQVTLPGGPSNWNRLAVHHVRTSPTIAYAFGASDGRAFLYRRDSRRTWRPISIPSRLRVHQAWYDWFLAAAPDRTDQVYLGAINVHRGDLTGSTWNWTNLSAKTSGDSIHPDQHAIAFHPTNANIIFVGNDGGLYRSNNRGINWQSLNNGLAITEFEYIAQDLGSSRWIMGGTQDNGTNRYRGSRVWDHIADGDGGDCSVNSINPDIIYHSFYGMGLRRSNDRGETWRSLRLPPVTSGYKALFYPPMEGRGNTIAQAGESVMISRDTGNNWVEVRLPGSGRPRASAMYMPTDKLIYVGTENGRIFRISWNGSSWGSATELTSPRRNAWVSDLHVDPKNTNRIWATYTTIGGGRVFRSTNGGSSWTDRSAGLPTLPMNAVEVDPGNSNRIWVAADLGVYQSFNAGTQWAAFSRGLPNVLVVDLIYHPHARVLRAGTRNRGVWEIPVNGWLRNSMCGRQWTGSLAPRQTHRWFTHSWPATWHVMWTLMPTSVRRGAPQISWNVQVERGNAEHVTYWITAKNLTSSRVNFEGRYCILSFY